MCSLQWSWDVCLLERCPHFRGCYVQSSMELGPEDVSLLERCPHFFKSQALLASIMNVRVQQVSISQVKVSERNKTSCVVVLHSSKVHV